MTPRLSHILAGAGLALALLAAAVIGVDIVRKHVGSAAEIQSAVHQGEANAHVSAAQAIPDHAAELQGAKDDVARARAEVARVKLLLAAQQGAAVLDPAGTGSTVPPSVDPDPRDQVIASQGVLIEEQDGQIAALGLALEDEQRRSAEFKEAFEAERKATAAQAAATKAWKEAVTTSRWRGRIEGFASGVALGYLGGKR